MLHAVLSKRRCSTLQNSSYTNHLSTRHAGHDWKSKVKLTSGLLHMDTPVLGDQWKLMFITSVQTLDAIKGTCQEWWLIGMDSKRVLKECVLSASLDDDNDNDDEDDNKKKG